MNASDFVLRFLLRWGATGLLVYAVYLHIVRHDTIEAIYQIGWACAFLLNIVLLNQPEKHSDA